MKEKSFYTRITVLMVVGCIGFLGYKFGGELLNLNKSNYKYEEDYFISDEYDLDGEASAEAGEEAQEAEGGGDYSGSGEAGEAAAPEAFGKEGQYKDIAQKILEMVNAERQAKEIETLDWEDSTYSYCCNRAVQIVTTFNNEQKKSYYGENISKTDATFEDADAAAKFIHEIWSKSENDQNNYLDTSYISCSIAVYFKDGTWYAVETFSAPYSADFARQELLESSIDAYASTYGYCQHSVCSEPAFEYGDHWICSKCYGILSYDYNAKYNDRKFSCGCLAADSGIEQTDSGYKCINCGKTVEVHEVEFDDEMTTEAVYYYD